MKDIKKILTKYGITSGIPKEKVTKIGRDMFQVPSRRRKEVIHTVDLEGKPHCSCEDKNYNQPPLCFHIKYVMALQEAKLI